ncbi:MAG: hypothetical protein IAF38_11310 [Bacteroidia bacterium]|nr:hypothetical protein [Bacteroidia bacterium]
MEDELIINKGYLDDLGVADLVALPIYLMVIIFIGRNIRNNNIELKPYFKYFTLGLYAKIFGAIAFCFVYTYYYKGGDTIAYYESSRAFANLLTERPGDFADVYFSPSSTNGLNTFSYRTGYPWAYMYFEDRTLFLIKFLTPIVLVGFKSYLLSTILLSVISFSGLWQAFKLMIRYYPQFTKECAIGILFMPTAVFWGSGMLKDNVTLSGICWFIVAFERFFISKNGGKKFLAAFLISGYLVLMIKPYIIMTAFPGIIIWLFYSRIYKIKNPFLRYSFIPFIMAISVFGGYIVLAQLGDRLGKFSLDKLMETATVSQEDLKRDYYQGNSFDIGTIDPTIQGFLEKSPQATLAGLYRPFLWESKNVGMILSGLENFFLLVVSLVVMIRLKIFGLFKYLFDNPLLLFLFLYSILFAYSIGISTSNFGALIRFKIAYAPFFATAFLILYRMTSKKYKNR